MDSYPGGQEARSRGSPGVFEHSMVAGCCLSGTRCLNPLRSEVGLGEEAVRYRAPGHTQAKTGKQRVFFGVAGT